MKHTKPIAVIDFETDPFKFGRVPQPFAVEFFSAEITWQAWGKDCAAQLYQFLVSLNEPHLIYAHNGGKFDIHFLHEFIENPMQIINGRIVKCHIEKHEMRDSLAIIPVSLAVYEKNKIDYELFEEENREAHKSEIMEYMHSDCVYLFELVSSFVDRFGPKLTVGSTAMAEIKKRHKFEKMLPENDAYFRQFYFGGRVQCFQTGLLKGPWKSYDVNSMYPFVMRNFKHPLNSSFENVADVPDNFDHPYFLHFRGKNRGALPTRTKTGLSFEREDGEFFACSHEIEVGLEFGLIEIDEVLNCLVAMETISFVEFVDDFYEQKVSCKKEGDKIGELFAKFMLNSGYGKFGQNPENFEDWHLSRDVDEEPTLEENGFELRHEFEHFNLWARPAVVFDHTFNDVSIAASITSASRATLLRGLQAAIEPIYCDTDSIICREFRSLESGCAGAERTQVVVSSVDLGAWKLEATAEHAAIAGKKLYTLYDASHLSDLTRKPHKIASKGGTVPLAQMIEIAKGGEFEFRNPAPVFSVSNETKFISRKFKKTG